MFYHILGHMPYEVPFLAFHTPPQSFTEHLHFRTTEKTESLESRRLRVKLVPPSTIQLAS